MEPLKLADGSLVYPNGKVVKPGKVDAAPSFVEIPTNREATQLVVATRRKLSDLPNVPKQMNAVSAILSYSLFGLSDTEIALATGLSTEQLAVIKEQEAYKSMHRSIVESVLSAESDNVRDLIAQKSRKAVAVMTDALDGEEVTGLQVAAAKDFLDRAGHRPADVVEHRHKLEGGLVIEIIRKDDSIIPTIDMEVDE